MNQPSKRAPGERCVSTPGTVAGPASRGLLQGHHSPRSPEGRVAATLTCLLLALLPAPLLAQPASPTEAMVTTDWGLPPVPPPPMGRGPYLDRPDAPPPGWFTNLQLTIARPHLRNRLIDSNVTFPGSATATVQVPPDARLGWTVQPQVEVGYRLPDGFGDFRVGYRFVSAEETGQARTRLDLHDLDFDYTTWEFSPWPHWEMEWTVGVKAASLFFDSHFDRPYLPDGSAGLSHESASNSLVGAGPRAALALSWQSPCPGWSVVGRAEAAALWVLVTQRFRETAVLPGGSVSGYDGVRKPQGVPELGFQLGLKYEPPGPHGWGVFAGYAWEGWWSVGRVDLTGSRADLFQNGIVLRAEYTF